MIEIDKGISLEQIQIFSKKYNENETNKIIEKEITKKGLETTCIDEKVILENQATLY